VFATDKHVINITCKDMQNKTPFRTLRRKERGNYCRKGTEITRKLMRKYRRLYWERSILLMS